MKILKKILICTIFFIIVFTINNFVSADTNWTDFSNAKLELMKNSSSWYSSYALLINNVSFSTEEGTNYYVFIQNSSTKPDFGDTIEELQSNCTEILYSYSSKVVPYMDRFIERNGDIYIWIVEGKEDGTHKEVLSAKKIDKPELGKVGTRFIINFDITDFSIIPCIPTYDSRAVTMEIGKVEDEDLLISIKKGETDALDNLLAYAKSAEPLCTKRNTMYGGGTRVDSLLKLDRGDYYYVYVDLDTEDGQFRDVEDVSLYQAINKKQVEGCNFELYEGTTLANYLSEDFLWKEFAGEHNADAPGLNDPDDNNVIDDNTIDDNTIDNNIIDDNMIDNNTVDDNLIDNNTGNNQFIDNTIAPTRIPQTGSTFTIVLVTIIIVALGIVCYAKIRGYIDI